MKSRKIIILGFYFYFIIYASGFFYVDDQTKQENVLQFGEPMKVIRDPGLNFKIPFAQNVIKFDKRILLFDYYEVLNGSAQLDVIGPAGLKVEIWSAPYILNNEFKYHIVDSDLMDEIILSGDGTAPEFGSPFLILSINSIPLITFPNTEYCLSKCGAESKHIKN